MVVEWLWRSVICPFTLRCHKFILIPDLQTKALPQSLCHLLTPDCDWLLSLKTLDSLHPLQSQVLPWHGLNVCKTCGCEKVLLNDWQAKVAQLCDKEVNSKKTREDHTRFPQTASDKGQRLVIYWAREPWGRLQQNVHMDSHMLLLCCCSKWNVLLVFVLNRTRLKKH